MKIKFIGITGGSGAGKSTLCDTLRSKYPEKIEAIRLDDYFKPNDEKPKVGDIVNHDHPDSLYIDRLANDLLELSKGNSIIINTKNTYLNPTYEQTKKKIPFKFYPKPIILVEGFLILTNKKIRNMLNESIYLDIKHDVRWTRRVHFKNDEYEKKVIVPMHNKYIEPTKKYASHIIDVTHLSKEQVLEKVEKIINI